MSRTILLLWAGTIAALGALLTPTVPDAVRAHQDAGKALDALHDTAAATRHVATLRAELPELPPEEQTQGGLTPRVTSTLERSGLPVASLANLSPEAQSAVASGPGLKVMRRRATLTLVDITLPQLGRFLSEWRQAEPGWTPVSIDLAPAGGKPRDAGGDLPIRAVIVIETVAVHHDGDSP